MNDESIRWIFGGLIAGAWSIGAAALTLAIKAIQKISDKTHHDSERITRLEALAEIQGRVAARRLHSPHTPVLDRLLEKYYDRNYELSYGEWEELLVECEKAVEENKNTDKADFASFLAGICHHKLRHDVPKRQSIEENKK